MNGTCNAYKDGNAKPPYIASGAGGGLGGDSIDIFFKNQANRFAASKFALSNSYSPTGTYNVGTIKTGTYEKLEF